MSKSPGVKAAIQAARTAAAIADGLGISRAAVSQWNEIPAERVIQVERLTGVHRSILRPDLYPQEAAE